MSADSDLVDSPPTAVTAGMGERLGGQRVVVALAAGLMCLIAVATTTGLVTGRPRGAGDNGDGQRLYCGAGLVPATPDSQSNWKGGVVVEFDRGAKCPDAMPSSALPVLRAAVGQRTTSGTPWSLTRLGWIYALLGSAVTAAAAWAAATRGLRRVAILLPPVIALVDPRFSRFFVSTYAEPAGLLGAFGMACGIGVLVVTDRSDPVERTIAMTLVAMGGFFAATGKIAYAPLFLVAVLVCIATPVSVRRGRPRWQDRLIGPAIALVSVVLIASPLATAMRWQTRHFAAVNTENLVYTVVLTEVPGSTHALGLPTGAARFAGNAYFPNGPAGVVGADVIAAHPDKVRKAAWRTLVSHPAALLRAVGVAVQSTRGAALSYLPSAEWTPVTKPVRLGTLYGEEGASAPTLRSWLDGMTAPWWPSLLLAVGLLTGIAGIVWRRRVWAPLAALVGLAAVSALALAVAALLGDGYFEIAKHVWLAAYLLEVTLVGVIGIVLLAGVDALTKAVKAPSARPSAGGRHARNIRLAHRDE